MERSELRQSAQRHWLLYTIVLLALSAAAYGLAQRVLGPKVPVISAAYDEVLQTVVASGRVETPLRVEVGSQITGAVASIPVAEGQTVRAGQLIIALENSEARAAVAAARASIVEAQAKLRQIRELTLPAAEQALRQATANLQNARQQYARSLDLRAKGFIGQSQLDDAQMNLDVAESRVRAAQLDVEANRPQGSATLLAQTTLEQARASLATALAKLDYTTIEAPCDGTLIARDVERGDVVQPGKVLMVLSPTGITQLVVQIDEKNMSLLELGQPALGSADAYPDDRFKAKVTYINPAVDPQRGSVEVKLDVPTPPAYLRQDMTVSVDIEVARRSHTLVLPIDAVHESAGSSPWVMKVEGGRARREGVQIGARGTSKIEILAGLKAADVVIAANKSNLPDGARVRPVPAKVNAKGRLSS